MKKGTKNLTGLGLILVILLVGWPGSAAPAKEVGTIMGSLGYPSDFIPPDMVICAQNLATQKKYCTNQHLKSKKFTHGVGYRLEVPVGKYVVYAYLPHPEKYGAGFPRDYRAYFSEFVKCGMRAECTSHQPVVITVKQGAVLSGIDPQDWYK